MPKNAKGSDGDRVTKSTPKTPNAQHVDKGNRVKMKNGGVTVSKTRNYSSSDSMGGRKK